MDRSGSRDKAALDRSETAWLWVDNKKKSALRKMGIYSFRYRSGF